MAIRQPSYLSAMSAGTIDFRTIREINQDQIPWGSGD